MDVSTLIEQMRSQTDQLAPPAPADTPLVEYSRKTVADLQRMLKTMLLSRRVEIEEKLLLRKGHVRFYIGGGGKELADIILAEQLRYVDPFVGYYRNKAFELHRGVDIRQKILEAMGDSRADNKGMQQGLTGYPKLSILPQTAPTGDHALDAASIAEATAHPSPISEQSEFPEGRWPSDAVTVCSLGDGATNCPEFGRAVFNSVFFKTRTIFAVYNCGWAISVSAKEQFPEGDLTIPYRGYEKHGLKIMRVDGTDIKEMLAATTEAIAYSRSTPGPVLMDIKVTRSESHSGSDDQSHYMDPVEYDWHIFNDCVVKTCNTMIADGIITPSEICSMWDEISKEVATVAQQVVSSRTNKSVELITETVTTYNQTECMKTWQKYRAACVTNRSDAFEEYHQKGYFPSPELPEEIGLVTLRQAINYTLFDLFTMTTDVILLGEDVADFSGDLIDQPELHKDLKGKGGVFLVTKNLQREFGNDRCFNTPLDEASVLSRAAGHAFQGRRPMPEIQFIDYMSPAYQQLKDRIATTYQRSGGLFNMPMVIRTTYGGYKQGAGAFWHSEANLGTWMNIPGLHIVVPSNAYDAAGLLKTAWACDDPVLFCESVSLYNRRDWEGIPVQTNLPEIDELIPFGQAKVYDETNCDLTMITYGATVHMCRKVAQELAQEGINARVVDLRTVKPLDEACIIKTAEECGRVIVVTEDRFHGGAAATIAALITSGDALYCLEAPVKLVTAVDARVAVGLDGDAACLPTGDKILAAARDICSR